ncbi:hypothetical protein D3C76_1278330 [compost metagenome]
MHAAGDGRDTDVGRVGGNRESDAVIAHGQDVGRPVLAEAGSHEVVQCAVTPLGFDVTANVHGGLGGALRHPGEADLVVLFRVEGRHQAVADAGQHLPVTGRRNARRHLSDGGELYFCTARHGVFLL